jgi:hypothetical protein
VHAAVCRLVFIIRGEKAQEAISSPRPINGKWIMNAGIIST